MAYIKVEGIVISEMNYKETSKIINILTKEYGKIGIISKGCRSLKSNLRSVSKKLIHGTFNISYKPNTLSTLIDVEVINDYSNIATSIEKITYASIILDLFNQVLKQTTSDDMLDLLHHSLNLIENDLDYEVVYIIVSLKLLEYLGVKPDLEQIDLNDYQYSDKTKKLITMFFYVDLEKITKLTISDKVKREIEQFVDQYYQEYTGIYLKSSEFLKYLKQLT